MTLETLPAAAPAPTIHAPPDLTRAIDSCLAGLSPNSRRAYSRHIARFQSSGRALDREGVSRWAQGETARGQSGIAVNQALSALKRLASEAAALGWLDHTTAIQIGSIKSRKYRGTRTGKWLTIEQARALLALPDRATLAGRRDAVVLGLLIGCGLRRAEACALEVSQVQTAGDGMILSNVLGKGNRVRTLRVPAWLARDVQTWRLDAGNLLRSIHANGVVNGSLSPSAIRDIVRHYAALIGIPDLAPHDLRRTCARLAREGGAPLEVIQQSLGHASIATTERYLGSTDNANAGDYIQIEIQTEGEGEKK